VTESDVESALEALNARGGKTGAVIIVLMPDLAPESRDAPGPRYYVRYGLQIIVWPPAALSPGGAGLTAEEIAEYLRQIVHHVALGRSNVLSFDGQQPTTVAAGKVSWTVYFRRLGGDEALPKVVLPGISAEPILTGDVPTAYRITLSCTPPGSAAYTPAIWYTIDGSYPAPGGATSIQYQAPFVIAAPCLLRVTATADGLQQSDAIEADISPLPAS
jgi:hypothetical protein